LLLDELEDWLDELLEDDEFDEDTLAELLATDVFCVSTNEYPILK
jgi:hypothetical protein